MNPKCRFEAKRVFDVMCSLILLVVFLPVFVIAALAILIDSGKPVFFTQTRVGKGGRCFKIYKFRTMIPNAVCQGGGIIVQQEDSRITRVGKFLRRYSLDELPQLLNVLMGDMSLVGPRPTLEYQVRKYTPVQYRRLEVKPGMTGWAQVNGRNSLSWEQKINLDIWYVNNHSILLDVKILFLTLKVVFNKHEIYVANTDDKISKTED